MNHEKLIVNRIVSALGITKAKLGEMFNVSRSAVNGWTKEGIPSEHCKELETLLKNTADPLTCKDMRPDDWHKWWPKQSKQDSEKVA